MRDRGIKDAASMASRCDGIILCGGRISSGMRTEMGRVQGWGAVIDLTHMGELPPTSTNREMMSAMLDKCYRAAVDATYASRP
jgi:hypothetical protein